MPSIFPVSGEPINHLRARAFQANAPPVRRHLINSSIFGLVIPALLTSLATTLLFWLLVSSFIIGLAPLATPFRLLFFHLSFIFILGLGSPTLQPDGSITWQAVIRMPQKKSVSPLQLQIFYSKISTLATASWCLPFTERIQEIYYLVQSMKSNLLNLKAPYWTTSQPSYQIAHHKQKPDNCKYSMPTSSLSSLALWPSGSCLNSPVSFMHSSTFSGETKSIATLMQDCTNRNSFRLSNRIHLLLK